MQRAVDELIIKKSKNNVNLEIDIYGDGMISIFYFMRVAEYHSTSMPNGT